MEILRGVNIHFSNTIITNQTLEYLNYKYLIMKYLIVLSCFLSCSKAIAQGSPFSFPYIADSLLTIAQRDSLKRNLIPHPYIVQMDKERREYAQKLKYFLKKTENTPVPNFEARDTSGFTHRPSSYQGHVWLIHFWRFWDYSFQNEIPRLNEIIEKYGKDGVKVLSFVDLSLGDAEKKYLTEHPVYFPIIENAHKFSRAFLDFDLGMPYIVFIDKYGKIRFFTTSDEMTSVRSNVNEKAMDKQQKPVTYNFEERVLQLLKE